jgi:hypothetical protein
MYSATSQRLWLALLQRGGKTVLAKSLGDVVDLAADSVGVSNICEIHYLVTK